jgi:uncharacterized surface protein with fasciclin (FAS1) repeats
VHEIDGIFGHRYFSRNIQDIEEDDFSRLAVLAEQVGLNQEGEVGNSLGPQTFFVPRNAAFDALVMDFNDNDLVRELLLFHVVPDFNIYGAYVYGGEVYTTLQGEKIAIWDEGVQSSTSGYLAKIVTGNIYVQNG